MDELVRLDIVLKEKYDLSRQKCKELIESRQVSVNGNIVTKPSTKIDKSDIIELKPTEILKYVSRGGLKLEKAINCFGIDLKDKVCGDIGASTGGFTDCMIQNGAKKVYAIDVGSNQLANKIRENKNVISMENTNIKDITINDIGEYLEFISIDVSFISLTKILSYVSALLMENGEVVALIKPQFEVGKGNIGKNGIVKDSRLHKKAIIDVLDVAQNTGIELMGLEYSPIKGGNGNIEYLAYMRKSKGEISDRRTLVDNCVNDAHRKL